MSLPPPATLRAFEAAARLESFARAGDELHVSAAAISQHVRTLELWLGQPLFRRHAQGVELTLSGRELGAAVTDGLARIARVADRLRLEGASAKVSIGCISSVATRWLIPRLPAFERSHPDIRLQVVYAFDHSTPQSTDTDLLIRHGRRPAATAYPLLSAETRPVCAPGYRERFGAIGRPQDLLDTVLLHDETPRAWEAWLKAAGVEVPARLRGTVFQDATLTASATIQGQGIGLLPTRLFADELLGGALVVLFDTPSDSDKHYWLVEGDGLSPSATLFRDWLLAEAGMS
jgi:LysR family glycine cleavage system transcriptional activator